MKKNAPPRLYIADDMHFGVELEALLPGKPRRTQNNLLHDLLDGLRPTLPVLNQYDMEPHTLPPNLSADYWTLTKDISINPTLEEIRDSGGKSFLGFELASPKLDGSDGLTRVSHMLKTVIRLGARANASCGFHVHTAPKGRWFTDKETRNFVAAAIPEESAYNAIIASKRWDNPACEAYLSTKPWVTPDIVDTASFKHITGADKKCKITLCRLPDPTEWGNPPITAPTLLYKSTIEYRGKEGEGFEKNQGRDILRYIATVVTFTSMAIKDRHATFEQAAAFVNGREACPPDIGRTPFARTPCFSPGG